MVSLLSAIEHRLGSKPQIRSFVDEDDGVRYTDLAWDAYQLGCLYAPGTPIRVMKLCRHEPFEFEFREDCVHECAAALWHLAQLNSDHPMPTTTLNALERYRVHSNTT